MDHNYNIYIVIWFLIISISSWATLHFRRRGGHIPPGPTPLPIIGNLLNLGKWPHASLARLAQIHGPIMSLRLGTQTTIVISSASLAKQVLQKHDVSFSHRFPPAIAESRRHHDFSMVWLPPHATWRNLRKIAHSQIFFSSRLDASSHLRRAKVQDLLSYVETRRRTGGAVDVGLAAFNTTLNMLSNTFFSAEFSELGSGRSGGDLKGLVWKIMDNVGKVNLSDLFPVLKGMDLQGLKGKLDVYTDELLVLFDAIIDKRMLDIKMKTATTSTNTDALDALLRISQDNGDEDTGFNLDYVRHMLVDMFIAGTETTSSTLEWVMAELLHNPTKMTKVSDELQAVIGKGNHPVEEADISKLPYLHAVIKETFRMHPAAPFLIPRKAETDVELSGFTVPKHSKVLVNSWAIGRDPRVWENANAFEPERFLRSVDIDVKGHHFELAPFGSGRRICPGMPLAMRMLPMMLASLIRSFDWKLEDGLTPDSLNMDDKFGFTLPKSQPLRAVPLKKSRVNL